MSSAIYSDAHYLLCHDDELEGRRIAYIIYLTPEDWTEADGGLDQPKTKGWKKNQKRFKEEEDDDCDHDD